MFRLNSFLVNFLFVTGRVKSNLRDSPRIRCSICCADHDEFEYLLHILVLILKLLQYWMKEIISTENPQYQLFIIPVHLFSLFSHFHLQSSDGAPQRNIRYMFQGWYLFMTQNSIILWV